MWAFRKIYSYFQDIGLHLDVTTLFLFGPFWRLSNVQNFSFCKIFNHLTSIQLKLLRCRKLMSFLFFNNELNFMKKLFILSYFHYFCFHTFLRWKVSCIIIRLDLNSTFLNVIFHSKMKT